MEGESLKNKLAVIILAAGKGTRMKSDLPKVLHTINNKTMIEHVISKTKKLNPEKIIAVIGYKAEQVKKYLKKYPLSYALQKKQKGTGHAVMQCHDILKNFDGDTLILSGDVPLIKENTLIELHKTHAQKKSSATLLSAKLKNPDGYGRIIRKNKKFISIVEQKDASETQKNIKEINGGIYIFNNKMLFENITKINNNNNQSEYYLPDVIPLMIKLKQKINVYSIDDSSEIKGVNTLEQLQELQKLC